MHVFLAQDFHDISPPVDYFLLQPWMIFCAVASLLLVTGLTIWLIKRWRNRPVVVQTPRQRALDLLARIETEIDKLTPYQFSIRVSDATVGAILLGAGPVIWGRSTGGGARTTQLPVPADTSHSA